MPFDTSRLIFTYDVGGARRFADPLAVRRRLLRASAGSFDDLQAACGAGGETPEAILAREEAREKVHAIICSAFAVTPFDPATSEGVTEAEATGLLDRFLDWLDGPPPPMQPDPTE